MRLTLHARSSVPPAQIRIYNPWARLGLVFYVQTRRGWILRQLLAWTLGQLAPTVRMGWGFSADASEPPMETGLRARVYDLGPPRFWERIRYCLDREGNYHPELRGPMREYRRMLRNSPMATWLEPHPVLTGMRQESVRQAAPGQIQGARG